MKRRGNQLAMRTVLVRALSFSAVVALTLNPALAPVVAAEATPVVAAAQAKTRFLALGIGKSVVVDLPRDVKDVLVPDPKIAHAGIRSPQRAYILARPVDQTTHLFFP